MDAQDNVTMNIASEVVVFRKVSSIGTELGTQAPVLVLLLV